MSRHQPRRPHGTRRIYDDEAIVEGALEAIEARYTFDINEGICKTPKRRVQ